MQAAGVSRPLAGMVRKSLHMQSFLQQKDPVTEATPLENPFWQYSRDKIACEERLLVVRRARIPGWRRE